MSIPDFYSHGGVAQGVEPFLWPEELRDVLEEFGHSGELEPRVIQSMPAGLAAWIKTELKPNHQFEAPFAFVWHDPTLPDGMSRSYTNYLGRTRPDNAVVWLAEQAFEDFGVETATYKYWIQVIADWQATSQN